MDKEDKKVNPLNAVPWWVKSVVLVGVAGVFCYKVAETQISLQFDFPAFLALLLALFSIGLGAMFYFKATDTSNVFYDNTYKFTRDIADLLVRIESGFGEKLRHLEEYYKDMQGTLANLPSRLQVQQVADEVSHEEEEREKLLAEKDELIKNLMARANMKEDEARQFLEELQAKDSAFRKAEREVVLLQDRLACLEATRAEVERVAAARAEAERVVSKRRERVALRPINAGYAYLAEKLRSILLEGPRPVRSVEELFNRFEKIKHELGPSLLRAMEVHGLIDQGGVLTHGGRQFLASFLEEPFH